MELKIFSPNKEEKGSMKLPSQFNEAVRPDIIKRACLAIQANARQPYGAKWQAGMRQSAKLSRRRRDYKAAYGHGISRVPRKILNRRGERMYWVGAVAPGTVGGREAHPPKPFKNWTQKINVKERRMAIRSALAATVRHDIVAQHGYRVPDNYPFILSEEAEKLDKAKDVVKMLNALGFGSELERAKQKKRRTGKGTMRNRPYKKKTSLLFVVADTCKLMTSARNIAGVDILKVSELNASVLAPGGVPGRAALFTQQAIKKMDSEKLFARD